MIRPNVNLQLFDKAVVVLAINGPGNAQNKVPGCCGKPVLEYLLHSV